MPRYIVERTFPDRLEIPVTKGGAEICLGVVERNAQEGVRKTAAHNSLPVDRITEVRVLDPYFPA